MALEAQLTPLNVPAGTEFPGTVQGLLQLLSEYLEITGLENFAGVNYGSVEPDPADRDKAWLRTDGSGNFLGWYVWTGSAWTILPAKAYVGTAATRDALINPQDGWMFHVVGTGLSTYVESEAEWQWAFPAANEDLVGDKTYLFSSHQLLVSATSAVPTWTQLDLTSLIASSGIDPENISAAIVRVDAQFGSTLPSAGITWNVVTRAWGSNLVSTGAGDILLASAYGATNNNSATAAANTNQGYVPMTGGQTDIWYNVQVFSSPPGIIGSVWLVGFLYTPTLP
jgi:hypothetical protein